jgi:hypothetical protein
MKAVVNPMSIIKRNGKVAASLKLTTHDGVATYYACQMLNQKSINTKLIYRHMAGGWQLIESIDPDVAEILSNTLVTISNELSGVCNKRDEDAKGEFYRIWPDAYITCSGGLETVKFKLGFSLVVAALQDDGSYKYQRKSIADLSADYEEFVPSESQLARIEQKVMKVARNVDAKFQRWEDEKLIGFKSKADMANYKHSTGQYAQSHRQYTRRR